MCEFISWIEKNGNVYFLTTPLVEIERGRTLLRDSWEDRMGHGAIRLMFGLEQDEGQNRECTDFSSPDNFPRAIAQAIKNGEMRGMGVDKALLNETARTEYERIAEAARTEYERIAETARAEYERIAETAWAEYERIIHPARAEYERIKNTAFWDLFAIPNNRVDVWK